MTIYVDQLAARGWMLRGHHVRSCHLVTDQVDLRELHAFAARIGMRREWFQDKAGRPHYDLTETRRAAAIAAGATECGSRELVAVLRDRQQAVERSRAWGVVANAYVAGARASGTDMANPMVRVATDDAAEAYASDLVGRPTA